MRTLPLLLLAALGWGPAEGVFWLANFMPGIALMNNTDLGSSINNIGIDRLGGLLPVGPINARSNFTYSYHSLTTIGLGIAAAASTFYILKSLATGNPIPYHRRQETLDIDKKVGLAQESEFAELMTTLDKMLKARGVANEQCQMQLICDVAKSPDKQKAGTIGHFIANAFSKLSKVTLDPSTIQDKEVKKFLEAALDGTEGRNCSEVYNTCGIAEYFLNYVLQWR